MRPSEPTEQHIAAAISWQLLLDDVPTTPNHQAEFDTWLRQDPCHAIAWQRIHDIHAAASTPLAQATLQEVAALHQQNVFTSAKQFIPPHVRKHKGILTALCFMALSYAYLHHQQWPAWALADYRSTTGTVRTLTLDDGSRLTLASSSAVDVVFSQDQRQIILRKGEVFADVAKDPSRPFVIVSQQGSATALGTQFSVKHLSTQRVVVTVLSSTVRACAANGIGGPGTQCHDLTANQAVAMTPTGLGKINPIDALTQTAWRDQVVIADNMRLSDLLAEIAAQHQGLVYFDQQAFSQHRISGVFPLDHPEQAFRAIQQFYPMTVNRYTPYVTTLTLKNKSH